MSEGGGERERRRGEKFVIAGFGGASHRRRLGSGVVGGATATTGLQKEGGNLSKRPCSSNFSPFEEEEEEDT